MKKKSTVESVAAAMGCFDLELVNYLPYILQDFWEMGSDPEVIIELVRKHAGGIASLKVLDLGCGKGAVSVKLAKALGCSCLGIDAVPGFISFAGSKSKEYGVDHLCRFEVGDIREIIKSPGKFDVIILGSIGAVFGDYTETLAALVPRLEEEGMIIADDGYVEDGSSYSHPQVYRRSELLRQLDFAGALLADERVSLGEARVMETYDKEFELLSRRCRELSELYPTKASLFEGYLKQQDEEYRDLKSEIICSTMVIKRKGREK